MAIRALSSDAVVTARYELLLSSYPKVRRGRHRGNSTALPSGSSRRLASLDGLRGIAAVIVIVHHAFLTVPALADPYLDPRATEVGSAAWWLTYTPAHLIWAGTEAVFVFFVLSGLVLALAAKPGWQDLRSYYAARLLRLYLPVWAAVAFAVLLAIVVPPQWSAGSSWWMEAHTEVPSVGGILADLVLLVAPGSSNHVLWSLQWEVVFSLALPLFILLAGLRWAAWSAKVTASVLAIGVAAEIGSVALSSLALFALGTLMATGRERLAQWAERLRSQPRPALWWAAILTVTAILLSSYWLAYAPGWDLAGTGHAVAIARALQAIGACMVVFIAWHWPAARRVLESRLTQWLGVRSFTLYLVHLPVVTTVALVFGGSPPLAVTLAVAVPLSLLVTAVFFRYVERPSHRLARRIARLAAPPRFDLVSRIPAQPPRAEALS